MDTKLKSVTYYTQQRLYALEMLQILWRSFKWAKDKSFIMEHIRYWSDESVRCKTLLNKLEQ